MLNRSALTMMEDLDLAPSLAGARLCQMNVWGRMTPLPNLRTVVSIADRNRLARHRCQGISFTASMSQ